MNQNNWRNKELLFHVRDFFIVTRQNKSIYENVQALKDALD